MTSYDSLANVHLSKYIIQNVRTGSFSWCNYIMLLISKHLSHNVQVHLEKIQLVLMSCLIMKAQLVDKFIYLSRNIQYQNIQSHNMQIFSRKHLDIPTCSYQLLHYESLTCWNLYLFSHKICKFFYIMRWQALRNSEL